MHRFPHASNAGDGGGGGAAVLPPLLHFAACVRKLMHSAVCALDHRL